MTRNDIQSKINQATSYYIFTYGVRGWNMDELASTAGITKRTLYKYVESKEKLVENFLIDYIRKTQRKIVDNLNAADDFKSGINYIIEIYPTLIINLESRIMSDIFTQYPNIEEAIINERKSLTSGITSFINQGKEQDIIEKNYDSQLILESIQSQIIFFIKKYPNQFTDKIRESILIFLYGIIKR